MTGFDAVTGTSDRIEFKGVNGQKLSDKGIDGPSQEAKGDWTDRVKETYGYSLLGNTKSWFTAYNSNFEGHDKLR